MPRVGPLIVSVALLVVTGTLSPRTAGASEAVGSRFPQDFPEIIDASLGAPVIGFGAEGTVTRTPVIFLHGNNDTPFPTECNGAWAHMYDFASYFHANGYELSELWALGYQGDQCDALVDPTVKSGESHSTVANVADLRAFVDAVLDYTGAQQVDVIGHSLGGTLTREWLRQDQAYGVVRRLVMVDSPHQGIINCSPSPANYYALPASGGFGPDSAICQEYGAPNTPLLERLNAGDPTPGPTRYLAIRNADTSFVYFAEQDGIFPPVPAEDRHGEPHDFSGSAALDGARNVDVVGQGAHDPATGTAHVGISNSPEVWQLALDFLAEEDVVPAPADVAEGDSNGAEQPVADRPLPATGLPRGTLLWVASIVAASLLARRRRHQVTARR